jgi:hypothetical protein
MKSTLRFQADGGTIECLYTEAIDLQLLGPLRITRATDIRFNDPTQQWQVHDAVTDRVLFSNSSRSECLAWENQNLQPRSKS